MGRTEAAVSSPKVPLPPRVCEFVKHKPRCRTSENLVQCSVCEVLVCREHSRYHPACETNFCLDCFGEHYLDCQDYLFGYGPSSDYDEFDLDDVERGKAGAA